jgi:hypothetical protein
MENWNRENNDPTEISPKNGNSAEKTLTADPSQVNQESGGKIVNSPVTKGINHDSALEPRGSNLVS